MTLDFTGVTGILTIYRGNSLSIPDRLFLTGLYNNELILNGEDLYNDEPYIFLNSTVQTERYIKFIWIVTNPKLQSEDIGGYYKAVFKSGTIQVPVLNNLCKVNNAFESNGVPATTTVHTSDNELNEQYTFFRT